MDDTRWWIALNCTMGLAASRAHALVEKFGSPRAVLGAGTERLASIRGVSKELASRMSDWRSVVDPDRELERAREAGARVICLDDEAYPGQLREIHDPPVVLYVKGTLEKADDRAIAIVGTRRPSHYGVSTTEQLAYDLASRGITIVSGLARGIDSAAHRGALAGGGRTIAVLGCGVDVVYPRENRALMDKVPGSGAVVSEFPMGTQPDRPHFPRRNRIISGLSLGTVVVEAAERSGSLITAGLALQEGREVFAVPGKVDATTSRGTNRLIKQGARLVENAADVLEELGAVLGPVPPAAKAQEARAPALEASEKAVYELLSSDPIHIDDIIRKTGMHAGEAASVLLLLEVKRLAVQLPGKLFARK